MANYKQSLIGFHNPYLHKDLTADEFLIEYVESLKKKAKKKNGWEKVKLAKWIEENWDDQLKFVSRLFPDTLKTNGDRSNRNTEKD